VSEHNDGVFRKRVSRRTVLKSATGAAAAFGATGVLGKSYQRALAQDSLVDQILKIPGKGKQPTDSDMEKVGELCLKTQNKGKFKGQTIRFQGLNNAGFHINVMRPLSKAWEDATGAKIEWIGVTQADSYPKMHQALSTNTVNFDILEGSGGWEGDLFGGNWCSAMPDSVKQAVDFDDIVPYLQNPVRTWNGTTYGMSIDGDCHMWNYRPDVFADKDLADQWKKDGMQGDFAVPNTWEGVTAMTKWMKGKTFEGQPLYGVLDTLAKAGGVSTYFFNSRASGYAKYPGNPAVFFDPKDMTPYINTPPFVQALQDIIDSLPGEPPDEKTADLLKTLGDFLAGTGSMVHWWADVGTNAYSSNTSVIQNKVNFDILPGATKVYNQSTKAWETINSGGTPVAGPAGSPTPGGGVNFAPYLAFLGWGLYVMKATEKAGTNEACWDLVTHLTSKEISLWENIYPSGFNPWRKSHFADPQQWTISGFPLDGAKQYLNAIQNSYNHPNRIIDLRIPGLGQYYETAESAWVRAVAGEVDAQTALDDAAKSWNQLTDQLGKENQIKLYQASLG
jgi:multiple sugar transport system substrate-binding protein